ncbi:hypothetical protein Moror_6214 [Moniliophthora roreri MCA 2997]|uniref:F-box domain-containing protein n=2 Tax=Moniliophthora roreri TaxID=221103 RepID=V2WW68_MONRO|nr:hypothetical protein Moror_6214 [Moniliophthora roreri MCA 2997]KAI3618303.1 hypothetical protein WG66_005740 [Moniliophthora roreri]
MQTSFRVTFLQVPTNTEPGHQLEEPNPKRVKTTLTSCSPASNVSAKITDQNQTSLLCSMPLDIIFLICSFLPAKTLIELPKINRLFRATLLSTTGASVWITLRNSFRAPAPMPGMSELEWARLLWGGTHCQVCGTKGVNRVDFILRKRICYACVKKKGIPRVAFKRRYPDADRVVLDLVLPTSGGNRGARNGYYHCEEIEKVIQEIALCKRRKAKENYNQKRKQFLKECSEHASRCEEWVAEDRSRKAEEADNVRESRIRAIYDRLRNMGYTEDDMQEVKWLQCVQRSTPLSEKSWDMISPDVFAVIRGYRTSRMLRDNDGILATRRKTFDKVFLDYKNKLQPKQWRTLPSIETMYLFQTVNEILVCPDSKTISEEKLSTTLETIQDEVDCWIRTLKRILAEDIAEAIDMYMCSSRRAEAPPPRTTSLDLAMTVIQCVQCYHYSSTLEAAVRHLHTSSCCEGDLLRVSQLFRYSQVPTARLLVVKSGLDPQIATPDDMDEIGAFYQCLDCEHHDDSFVATWRDHIRSHTRWYNVPQFRLLAEQESPKDERACWACGHCNAHINGLVTRADVLEHVKVTHHVSKTHVPQDFFYAGQ